MNPAGLRKFSKHVLECPTHSAQLPKELLELQGYLQQLTGYIDKYHKIKDNIDKQKCSVPSDGNRSREVSFSVKEEVEDGQAVAIIEDVLTDMLASVETKEPENNSGDADKEGESVDASSSPKVEGDTSKVESDNTSKVESDNTSNVEGDTSKVEGDTSKVESDNTSKVESDNTSQERSASISLKKEDDDGGEDVHSDDSEIGIYFIEDVKPERFINIVQRELCTLSGLFPGVSDIVKEIIKEFEHFKVCCSCLKKVTPILPDILKELQELIKFAKKKRNEKYTWPNDSDYLRKLPEAPSEPFKKNDKESTKRPVRKETVGFVSILTNTSKVLKEVEASIKGEHTKHGHSEHAKQCSVRVTNCPQLSLFQSKTIDEVRCIEKLEALDLRHGLPNQKNDRETLFLIETFPAQLLRTLYPEPVYGSAFQYGVGGYVTFHEVEVGGVEETGQESVEPPQESSSESSLDREDDLVNSPASEAKEFLLMARVALGEACLELQLNTENRGEMEYETLLKTDLRNLKDLMMEVHRNQIELSKFLLEKEVLNPALVQLTDPHILNMEREAMQKAGKRMTEAGLKLDDPTWEKLKILVYNLSVRCKLKNQMIIMLLKGLRNNLPKQHWEKLIGYMLEEYEAIQKVETERINDFLRRSSLTLDEPEKALDKGQERKPSAGEEFGVEDMLNERELKRTTFEGGLEPEKSTTSLSLSEIQLKASEILCTMEPGFELSNEAKSLKVASFTAGDVKGLSGAAEKDLRETKSCENSEHNTIVNETEWLKSDAPKTQDQGTAMDDVPGSEEPRTTGSTTINLTIKIGDSDQGSRYYSALSILPSGATLKEKKSETSLPMRCDGESRTSMHEFVSASDILTVNRPNKCERRGSFTSLALKLKLPLLQDEDDGDLKPKVTSQESDTSVRSEDDYIPLVSGSGTTCLTALHANDILPCSDDNFMNESRSTKEIMEEGDGLNCDLDMSNLYPQMNIQYEQNLRIQNLRERMQDLDENLRGLKTTIDRMSVVADKLVDDATGSTQHFEDIRRRYTFISDMLSE